MSNLQEIGRIVGSLGGMGELVGEIAGTGQITGVLGLPDTVNVPRYNGEYLVVPNFENQTLETNGKQMADDVEVLAIPVSIVENLSGGNTVYIGG